MIRFDILTIFPEMFPGYLDSSILGKAQKKKLIKIRVHNIRDYADGRHKVTDDVAYGGISGMVMKVEPIYRAVKALKIRNPKSPASLSRLVSDSAERALGEAGEIRNKAQKTKFKTRIVLLSAKGKVLTQQKVRSLAKYDQIILIAGHYKGVDERVAKYVADEEISIGEFVITGGELPAMIVVDAISRMVKGVVGKEMSKEGESFSKGVQYEHPVYTRPEIFSPPTLPKASGGKRRKAIWKVPPVLLSGDHKKIREWRERNRKNGRN